MKHVRSALFGSLAALAVATSVQAGGAPQDAAAHIVVIEPFKLEEHPSGDLMPNGVACAVRISGMNSVPQQVITVGTGESEALSCVSFIEAGPLPDLQNSIGLVYDFESGPNSVFRGAVILTWDDDAARWIKNEAYEGVLTVNSAVGSLAALRAALSDR